MFQQLIALIIIVFFISRLFWQKREKKLSSNEFVFWLVFWLLAAGAVLFLKRIDELVSGLGFSGKGIDVLLYIGVVLLFYFIFRLRIRLEKIERDITKIIRNIAITNKNNNKQKHEE